MMRQSQSSVLPGTITERIAGWSTRHKKTAIFGWLILVAVLFAAGHALGSTSVPTYDPGQSGQAERALQHLTASNATPNTEQVLISGRPAAAVRQATSEVTTALTRLGAVNIRPPESSGDSKLVTFTVRGDQTAQTNAVNRDLAEVARVQSRFPELRVAEAGDVSISTAVSNSIGHDFHKAEETTVPVTLILLLLVFGALVAAGIPLLLAGSAVMAAISVVSAAGRWLPVGQSTSEVVLIIGMAVGVDYTLFYLRREREERARGAGYAQALRTAARTSGRAIIVSGLTVMIAVAGLFLTGIDQFTGMAFGSIVVVGIAMVGSLTVLPALLSGLGPRADRGRIPFLGRRRAQARPSKVWTALVRRVVRRPLVFGGVATVALIALAIPALGMRLAQPAVDAPANLPVVQTLADIHAAFGTSAAPSEVVITGSGATSHKMATALTELRAQEPGTTFIRAGSGLIATVPMPGSGQDATSERALAVLRDHALPGTVGRVPNTTWAVAGDTATARDYIQQLHDKTPLVFAAVALLALGVLMLAFRSLRVAVLSIVLNLLSVGAAYGVITLIFQDGRLQGALNYTSFGGIIFWVPLFMFVFLFGISMDYHVFILSRIKERGSVVDGIASSAGVVTSAALIMVAVFSVFATLSLVDLKMLGIGTAAAVLIDATIVRGVLLPAALTLLGWGNGRHHPQATTPAPVPTRVGG
jgi:RND superfamily putative drug exporter